MNKEDIKKKPSLSWNLEDYVTLGDEPPECLDFNKTEGENMTKEEVGNWIREEVHCLSVFKEDYPDKFDEHYRMFLSDLEYLHSLGKITEEEYDALTDMGVFSFGQNQEKRNI